MSFNFSKGGSPISLISDNAIYVGATDATAVIYTAGQLYVGVAGTVTLIPNGANVTVNTGAVTFPSVPAGTILPILTRRVMSTGTTATGFVIIY